MEDKQLSIGANMLWNSFGSMVNLACQWLITIAIVRMGAGYEAAGIFSLAMSVYNIFAPIAQFRMYTYQITDVNKENSTGEYLAFRVITNGAALVLCMVYSLVTCDSGSLPAIFLYAVYKSICLIIDVFHACDQRNRRMDIIGQSLALQGLISLGLFILIFSATKSLEVALIAMSTGVTLIGLLFDWPKVRQFGAIHLGISKTKAKYLVLRCLPIVLASIAAAAAPSIPRQYLAIVSGDDALGIYAAAAAPVALIQTGASYIYNPLLGYFSELYFKNKRDEFIRLLLKATLGIVMLGFVCSAGVLIFGRSILVLVYGAKMEEYAFLMYPLVALALITGYMWFINDLLMAIRNFRGTVIGNLASLVVSITGLSMINIFGMEGVTYLCIASSIAGVGTMFLALLIQMRC